jgi:hypothetical protein
MDSGQLAAAGAGYTGGYTLRMYKVRVPATAGKATEVRAAVALGGVRAEAVRAVHTVRTVWARSVGPTTPGRCLPLASVRSSR